MISSITDKQSILLTGATGFVGQFILHQLLKDGRNVAVLTRERHQKSSSRRIHAWIRFWEQRDSRLYIRPKVITADLKRENLGLSPSDKDWIKRSVGVVLHCAASVRFDMDERTGEPSTSNVFGTQRMLDVSIDCDVPNFHYVSTAYVAGDRAGPIMESELAQGQQFKNAYERSKFDAELLCDSKRDQFSSLTIYRPSIVIGDSHTGFGSAFHTIYILLRLARALSIRRDLEDHFFDQMNLRGDERKNVVTVDWVAEQIVRLTYTPEAWGKTFHLTHPRPVDGRTIFRAVCDAVDRERIDWERIASWLPPIDFQQALSTHLHSYRDYINNDPVFDRTNIQSLESVAPPEISQKRLAFAFGYAIRRHLQSFSPAEKEPEFPPLQNILDTEPLSIAPEDSDGSCLSIQVSGPGGGSWNVDYSGRCFADWKKPTARAHLSGWAWAEMIQGTMRARQAYELGKLLIASPSSHVTSILELIDDLAIRSRASTEPHLNRPQAQIPLARTRRGSTHG